MDFQEFWKKLSVELKHSKRFKTLIQNKWFEVSSVDTSSIEVIPDSTKESRKIPIWQFQGMWHIMKNDPRNERYLNTNKRYYSFWSYSYINTLIDHVVADQGMK